MKFKKLYFNILHFLRNHKIFLVGIIVIIGILVFFLRPKATKPVPTQTITAQDFVQSLSTTGTITAENTADLTFMTGGTLAWLGVKKGDVVKQYQTFATLDARTTLKSLQGTLLDYSKQRNTFEQTQDSYANRTPEMALNDSMKRVLQNNQYDLNKAVVSVELQDLARQQSILTTPISGIVVRADAKTAGITITPSTTFTVVDPSSLTFKMEIDEADISKLREGQTVDVIFDAYPDKKLNLTIESIDFVTHTTSTGGSAYDVKAKIMTDNSNYQYRIGMNGNAEIILSKKQHILTVPLASLVDENKVYVKTSKGFEKKTLKLGQENDTSVEVLSGLSAGDVVATDPTLIPNKKGSGK